MRGRGSGWQQIVHKLFTASESRVALAQPALPITHLRESQILVPTLRPNGVRSEASMKAIDGPRSVRLRIGALMKLVLALVKDHPKNQGVITDLISSSTAQFVQRRRDMKAKEDGRDKSRTKGSRS